MKKEYLYVFLSWLVVALFVWIYSAWHYRSEVNILVTEREAALKEKYDQLLKAKDEQITGLTMQLDASKEKYKKLRTDIDVKEREYANVQTPATTDEVVRRLDALGYPSVIQPGR